MDAFQQYFDYHLTFICGIPTVTLNGTVEDWISIKERVQEMAQYNLTWWTDRLLPICDAFIETAKGNPPIKFWRRIYIPLADYGGEFITGWLADLFPYLKDGVTEAPSEKNHVFNKPRVDFLCEYGVTPSSIPQGLSQAPFILETLESEQCLKLVSGFLGVCQNHHTKELHPEIGWGVIEQDKFSNLLLAIKKNSRINISKEWQNLQRIPDMPKELVQILDHFDGAIMFSESQTPWKLRQVRDYGYPRITAINRQVTYFMDLKGGRSIAYDFIHKEIKDPKTNSTKYINELWILVGTLEKQKTKYGEEQVLENAKVIAKGMEQFFERILQAEGDYYFDKPFFIPDDFIESLM